MERGILALTLAAVIFCSLFSTINVFAAQDNSKKHVPGRLLVKFKDSVTDDIKNKIFSENAATVIDEVSQIKVKIIKVPDNAIDSVESALQKNNAVEYVEKDFLLSPQVSPNDPYFPQEWHLSQINAPNSWDVSKGDNIIVAILDSGIDSSHPDLQSKLVSGYNFYDNNNDLTDVCGHGTEVAGTAAAITNDGLGVAGIGWNSNIMPLKITDTNCYGSYSAMAKGITYAADQGAKVANISYLIYNGNTLTDAAQYMYNKGGWVVASGGNTGTFENYTENPYVISVSGTDYYDNILSFSSYGPYIDFAAPGVNIFTTQVGGSYGAYSGTSFSSPIVSGTIALMYSQNPNASPSQIYNALKQSAVDRGTTGYDNYFGWGRIDAYKALQSLNIIPSDTTAPSVSITSPSNGAYINTLSPMISGTASDLDDYVAGVSVSLDGNPQTVSSTSSWSSWSVTTTGLAQGSHTISVTSKDSHSNISTPVTSTFSIDTTAPTISITNPQAGSIIKGGVTISTSAADVSSISKVEIYIDGHLKSTLTTGPYNYYWNTKGVTNGAHTISAKAYDTCNNSASASVSVNTANNRK